MPIARAAGRVLIQGLVRRDLRPTAIIRQLARSGYTYRKQDMLSDIRKFSGKLRYEDAVRKVGYNEVIPRSYMVDTEFRRPFKYRVYGQINYYDTLTDSYTTVIESFYTDHLTQKGQWEDQYSDFARGGDSAQGREVVNFNITSVEHNIDLGY